MKKHTQREEWLYIERNSVVNFASLLQRFDVCLWRGGIKPGQGL